MAKSIFEIADSGVATVEHMGVSVKAECDVIMPGWWTTAANLAFNLEEREMWDDVLTMKTEDLRALLQAATAKKLIEIRAKARPAKHTVKDGEGPRELNEPYLEKMPQDRVDDFELKPMKRPGSGKVVECPSIKASATAQAMLEQGLDETMVVTVIAAGHGEGIAKKALALALSNMEE